MRGRGLCSERCSPGAGRGSAAGAAAGNLFPCEGCWGSGEENEQEQVQKHVVVNTLR